MGLTQNWHTDRLCIYTDTATGSAALAKTLAPKEVGAGIQFRLLGFRIHLTSSYATAENLTITLDSNLGAAYDAVVYTQAMTGLTSLVADYQTGDFGCEYFNPGDELDFAWANTGAKEYGLEILYACKS